MRKPGYSKLPHEADFQCVWGDNLALCPQLRKCGCESASLSKWGERLLCVQCALHVLDAYVLCMYMLCVHVCMYVGSEYMLCIGHVHMCVVHVY